MEKYNINLDGVSETLLIPVYARALESKKVNHEFYDEAAIKIVNKVDYDFSKFAKDKMSMWGCAARTIIFDNVVSNYINNHPNCSVINFACGLDARFNRVDNGKVTWYNIDFDNVIKIRKDLISDNDRVINMAGSVLDDFWYEKIENKNDILIVAEGILMYFEEKQVKDLFDKVARTFKNCTLACELMARWMVENQSKHVSLNETSASFKWGIENSKDFIKLCPEYKMIGDYNYTDLMKKFAPEVITPIEAELRQGNNRVGCFEKI